MSILTFLKKHLSAATLEQVRGSGQTTLPYRLRPAQDLPPEASRVGGIGYWPQDRDYPHNTAGQALALLAQFNLGELPPGAAQALGLPESGLLAFYINPHSDSTIGMNYNDMRDTDSARCIYFADTATPSLSRASQRAYFSALDAFAYLDAADADDDEEEADDLSEDFWAQAEAIFAAAQHRNVGNAADELGYLHDALMQIVADENAKNPPDPEEQRAMLEHLRQFVAAFDADVAGENDATLTQHWQQERPQVVALQPADSYQLTALIPMNMRQSITTWQKRHYSMPPAFELINALVAKEEYWSHPVNGEYAIDWQPLTSRYLLRDNREFARYYHSEQPQWFRQNGLDNCEDALDTLLGSEQTNNTLGGDPYFTQEDPRAADDDDVLLFQLDSEGHGDEVDIMWGDSGIGMFFIRPADLRARRFERAWFYWDCC